MTSNKVLLTYKRKRFRSQTKLADDIKVDAFPEPLGELASTSSGLPATFDSSNKKLNENDAHCFKCSTVDVNQNILVCSGCSGSYHLQCIDSSSKFILEGQWQCLACGKRCKFEEPMQIDSNTECDNIEELGTSPLKLPSNGSFQGACLSEEIVQIDNPSEPDGYTCRLEENKLPDDSGDCVSTVNKSSIDESPNNGVHPKGKISFLTFTRRVKKKKVAVQEFSEKMSEAINKHTLYVDQRRNELGGSSEIPDLLIVSDDSLGQAEHSPLHELLPNKIMVLPLQHVEQILDMPGKSEAANAEDFHKVKCAAGIRDGSLYKCSVTTQNSNISLQSHAPSQTAEFNLRGLSSPVMLHTNDSVTAATLVHKSKPSALVNTDTSIRHEHGNKLAEVSTLEFLLDSQIPLAGNSTQLLLDGKAGGLNRKMKSAETFDQALLDLNKEGISPNWDEQIGVDSGQSANARASNLFLLSSSIQSQFQDKSRDCVNQGSVRSDFSVLERQQPEEVSTTSFSNYNFLGLSPPLNIEGARDNLKHFRNTLLSSDFSANKILQQNERNIKLRGFGENSAMRRNNQIEDVLADTEMFKQSRSNLVYKYKIVSAMWSDDELDSLWVGVRRHGLNNWNAILRDPKLGCLKSRVPEELAEQWDREEIKLFNGTRAQPTRQSRQNLSTNSNVNDVCISEPSEIYQYGFNGARSSYSTVQTSRPETRLSLGDLFSQGESSKRQTPYICGQPIINSKMPPAGSFDSGILVSSNSVAGIVNQKVMKFQNNRYDCESSDAFQKSAENFAPDHLSSANSSLPHWLKDVNMPPRTTSPQASIAVSNIPNNNVKNVQNDSSANIAEVSAQSKSLRLKGMLKVRGVSGSKNSSQMRSTSVMTSEQLADLVVIDASSEETISDH